MPADLHQKFKGEVQKKKKILETFWGKWGKWYLKKKVKSATSIMHRQRNNIMKKETIQIKSP